MGTGMDGGDEGVWPASLFMVDHIIEKRRKNRGTSTEREGRGTGTEVQSKYTKVKVGKTIWKWNERERIMEVIPLGKEQGRREEKVGTGNREGEEL